MRTFLSKRHKGFLGSILIFLTIGWVSAFISCLDGGGGDETISSYSEKIINSEGGSISIIDGNNNIIEVTFPEDALREATNISLGVLPEQPDFPIETRHVSAFEIKPYDTGLYKPIKIQATHGNTIQNIERTLLYRKQEDSLIVPLANHEYWSSGTGDNNIVRGEAYFLGVFAEGEMSLDQINNQIDLLLDFQETRWAQRISRAVDSNCNTDAIKLTWNHWKETADGIWEFIIQKHWIGVYADNDEAMQEDFESTCNDVAGEGAKIILDKCIPEDLCDPNYIYVIFDALDTIWRLQCMVGNQVYSDLYKRYENIVASCIDEGTLTINLSASEAISSTGGPTPPYESQMSMNVEGVVQILAETVDSSTGFANIKDKSPGRFQATRSGSTTYFPGSAEERTCQISSAGYLLVEVNGTEDSTGAYSLLITTYFYGDYNEVCLNDALNITSPIKRRKACTFRVVLNSGNDYENTSQAEADSDWQISVELSLP